MWVLTGGGWWEDVNCACLLHIDIAFRLGFFVIETQRGGKKKVSMTKSVLQQWLTSMEIFSVVSYLASMMIVPLAFFSHCVLLHVAGTVDKG